MKLHRKEQIKELIKEKGKISLDELFKRYPEVSTMTIRRDLLSLEDEGVILRVRRGAVYIDELKKKTEDTYNMRTAENVEKKKLIARKAVNLIEPSHSLFIDSGSTTYFFAKELPDIQFFITTNGLNIATELSKNTMCAVTMVGGIISKNNLAASGQFAETLLDKVNIDTAVMACSAFDYSNGFTTGSQSEARLKAKVIEKARMVIMLVDSTKLSKSMPYTFAGLDDIDIFVSDEDCPESLKEDFKNRNIAVL